MTRSGLLLLPLASVLLLSGAATGADLIDPKDPSQGRFSDEWLEIYMAGSKIGYAHNTMARDGKLIHTASTMRMEVGRVSQPVAITVEETTTETLRGVPVRFESSMNMAVMKTAIRGVVKDGRVTIVTSQYGIEQTKTFEFPAGAVMTWGMYRESLLRGFEPGTQYTLEVYAPDLRLDGAVTATTRVAEWEPFEHRRRRLRGHKVVVEMKSPVGSLEIVSWVDKNGLPLKSVVAAAGMGDLVLIATDQQTALADFVPPEVFLTTVIDAKRKIDPKAAHRITYRIKALNADTRLDELPVTDMQTVAKRTDRTIEVIVSRQSHEPTSGRGVAAVHRGGPSRVDGRTGLRQSPSELAEYLEGNLMINTKDPELVKLAKRAANGETESFALGDRLRRFVTDYVRTKSLNVGFATASEVCRRKEGDCSEHALLLAALGRLNGLPSRVVVGLVYVPVLGERNDVFGYHMWTEFWIEGRWIGFDAALRESRCSPSRIAFATSSLKNSGLADLSLPLLSKIGAIDIEVLKVEEGDVPDK